MFIETMLHLLAFDLGWIVQMVMGNLIWVFFLAAMGYFLFKKPIIGGVVIILYLYATTDLVNILGWTFRQGVLFVPLLAAFLASLFASSLFGKFKWYSENKFAVSIMFYLILFGVSVLVV